MPPLLVIGPEGDGRARQLSRPGRTTRSSTGCSRAAELRLGGEHQQKVRIVRTDGRLR